MAQLRALNYVLKKGRGGYQMFFVRLPSNLVLIIK